MFERFTETARTVVHTALMEAERSGSDSVGTEHLVIALAGDAGAAGNVLRDAGASSEAVRSSLAELSADPLDTDALRTLGIDLDEVRRLVEESFGPGALERSADWRSRRRRHRPGSQALPLTRRAKTSLQLALREAIHLGHGYIGTEHLLLGVLREGHGLGVRLLVRRGVDPTDVRNDLVQRLRHTA